LDLPLRLMPLHLLPRCALLVFAALARPTEALETSDVQVAARWDMKEPLAEPISAPATEMERRAAGSHSPFVQARWWAHPETWGSGYRWSLTNGSLVFMTEQARHSGRLAGAYPGSIRSLRQTEARRLGLFEGVARYGPQQSFIDRLDVGWTLSPPREPLARQAWEFRRSESDPLILRLRRGVITVLAQRTF
jgi:hypothetical protein